VIEEEIYIEQLEGFEVYDRASHVCRLKRALCGLKQAPRAWYNKIDNYLLGMGFTKSEVDSNFYYILVKVEPLILVLYVDDLLMTGSEKLIVDCKRDLAVEFEMKDLGLMHYFLGLEVWQKDGQISLGKEICYGDPEAVWHARLLTYGNTHVYCYRANCRLGKAQPNPLDGDNSGRVYPLSPQINPPSLL
jgi:hypothetical protein